MASEADAACNSARLSVEPTRTNAAINYRSAALQIGASLLWIPQAALIAVAIADIANGAPSLWPCSGVLAIGIVKAMLEGLGTRLAFRAARSHVGARRRVAIAALVTRSPIDSSRPHSGQAASIVGEQAEAILPYIARFEIAKLRAVAVPAIILLVVLSISWVAAIVLMIAAPLIPFFMALIGWRAKDASERQLAETSNMNAFLLDRLRGITTIRALDAVDLTARRLRENADALRMRTMAVLRIAFLSSAVLELFSALGVAMVAVYVGFYLLGELDFGTWSGALNLREGLFILLLAPAFFEPLRELSSVWHDRASGRAAIDALDALSSVDCVLLGAVDDVPSVPHLKAPAVVIDKLRFRHSGSNRFVFDGLSLAIGSGEHVALVGPSGSGKSTLLALLAGLAPATSGDICIGGIHLSGETAALIRSHIAWIGQRPHIFAGTLDSNVSLNRDIDEAEIFKALDFAKLQSVATDRWPSEIGESGIGLSGGEALRLAIARVAVQRQVGLIIADEPTAHLDAHTATEITSALLQMARGKTMIVATHDLALAGQMDRVIHVHDCPLEKAA
jgi:ATP-binding cassette subfamily C protein CydD